MQNRVVRADTVVARDIGVNGKGFCRRHGLNRQRQGRPAICTGKHRGVMAESPDVVESPPPIGTVTSHGSVNKPRSHAEGLRELVTCPICLERLRRPKMLPCQHTFCLECLQCLAPRSTEKTICCPQCRSDHSAPPEGVAALPNNIYLQSLLDLLDTKETTCSKCNTMCEVTPCDHCSWVLCGVCLESHLDELRIKLGDISDQLVATTLKINNQLRIFKEDSEAMHGQIEAEAERRIQEVKSSEAKLVRHLQEAVSNEELITKEAQDKLDQVIKSLRKALDNDFDVVGQASSKIDTFLSLRQQASDLLNEMSFMDHNHLTFDPEKFELDVLQNTRKDSDVTISSQELPEEDAFPNCPSLGATSLLEEHNLYYRSRSFACRGRLGPGLLQRPSGLAVSTWSQEVFVVSMDSHRVFVFDLHTGRVMRSFGQRGQRCGEFLCPFGIALCPLEHKILVTDKWKHCIHVFDKEGQFKKQIGAKGRSPGHFRSPEAICVDQNGCIYVCDTCNSRIQVLDKEGNFVSEIGVRSQVEAGLVRQRSMFHEPTGIAVSPDGQKVYVCDFGLHRVHIFSPSGQHLDSFGQKGNLRGQFIHPECVAVDQKGFVFVGDCGNGRVQICRPDGRFVRGFGTKGSSGGQFSWISSIAVTSKYDVVVSDFKNHSVQVF